MKRILFVIFFCIFNKVGVSAQSVYKTPSGKKYHLETCSMVKNVSEKLNSEEAVKLGLEPCKICKPATLPMVQNLVNKARGEGKTVQCAGYTKSGSRCRHMTSIANGYCFQHQPKK